VQPSPPVLTLVPAGSARAPRWSAAALRRAAALALAAAVALLLAGALVAARRRGDAAELPNRLSPDAAALAYRWPLKLGDGAAPELDASIAALAERIAATPASPFDLGELADLHLRRGKLRGDERDFARAEELARRSLAALPTPNSAVLVLAKLASARHQFREAIALAQQHARGHGAAATSVLATAYLALGELPAASAAAEELVQARPSSAAYLLRALVMQAQGRDDEAAFDFTRAALAEDSGDRDGAARLRALWARFLISRGELDGAARLLDEALRVAPEHALALAQRAELALRAGQPRQASAGFEAAFASSRQLRYLIDQARAEAAAGAADSARALRAQAEQLVRSSLAERGLGHRLELVELLLERGDAAALVEADELAQRELELRPSAETRYWLARAQHQRGRDEVARRTLEAALASGARDARLYQLAADIERGRRSAARAALYQRLADALGPSGGAADGAP
jgi:Tfp pilus assembly protein PilF